MPTANDLFYSFQAGDESRPALVLLHGAGGTHLYWPPEIRRLTGYSVYALDLPGHGRSPVDSSDSIRAYTVSVREWMESVGLKQAVVAGHSMGSAIALTLALEYPVYVLGLVLLGAGARLRVHPVILENLSSEDTYRAAIQLVHDWAFSDQAPARLVELAARRMADTPRKVLHGDFIACNEFDVMDRLEEIEQPTLVLAGSADQLSPERYARFLAGKMPAAQFEVLAGGGHMLMLEQPEKVAEWMRLFLDQVTP
jgi:pimeloyl-ACP methyl ester carboxylesterase